MVATDIAARGIDIRGIAYVINFDMPDTAEAYTHRIGRTGRMHRSGIAMSFATPEDKQMLRVIERLVPEPMERKYIEVPHKAAESTPEEPVREHVPQQPPRRMQPQQTSPRPQHAEYQKRAPNAGKQFSSQRANNRQRPENPEYRHGSERSRYQEASRGPRNSQRANRRDFGQHSKEFASIP